MQISAFEIETSALNGYKPKRIAISDETFDMLKVKCVCFFLFTVKFYRIQVLRPSNG